MRPNVRTYLVDDDGERVFGPGPAELLRRVREHGSLRAAAMSMGMAYTKALALVRNAENALGSPLTTRVVGGAGGGGSTPTPEADALLASYERWTASVNATAQAQFAAAFGKGNTVATAAAEPSSRRIGVAVLAAGHARRFGSNKMVEPLLGEPVLSRTLGCLPLGLPIVVASATPEVDAICAARGIDVVRPEGPDQGDSVRALATYAQTQGWDACLFVPGDQPLLERESLQLMLSVGETRPDAVVRLSWRGTPASPALFPASAFKSLQLISGDSGGSAAATEGIDRLSVEATWPWELWDIDTPDDLARARQIIEAGLGRGGSA
jgi:molybdate transport repressor ModE-like protein